MATRYDLSSSIRLGEFANAENCINRHGMTDNTPAFINGCLRFLAQVAGNCAIGMQVPIALSRF